MIANETTLQKRPNDTELLNNNSGPKTIFPIYIE